MQQPTCSICDDPTDGYTCQRCAATTATYLRQVADLAGEVETTVARLACYATRGGRRAVAVEDDDRGPSSVNRGMPVASFGWVASKDRAAKGALRATALPVDLNASARAANAFNDVTTWARHVLEDRSGELPAAPPGTHPAAVAATFLLGNLDWLRHQRASEEAFPQLQAAGATIRRVVDAPPELVVVGVCDCGAHLYVRQGAATVTCQDCDARWDVEKSREGLREALRERLVTAPEAALLAGLFRPDLNRGRLRKLINKWNERGLIATHPDIDGSPTHVFGEIMARLPCPEDVDRATVAA